MAGTVETTEEKLIAFRMERFVELGFDTSDSMILAHAKQDDGWPLDTQAVKSLLNKGCPHNLVVRILR